MTKNLQGYLAAAFADAGGAAQNALLAAFDEGLGACLNTPNPALTKQVFGVPDGLAIDVGDAGRLSGRVVGRRRTAAAAAFEELYFEGEYGKPFKRDPAVVERLKAAKMIQDPAPLPGRTDEIQPAGRSSTASRVAAGDPDKPSRTTRRPDVARGLEEQWGDEPDIDAALRAR